MSRGSRPSAGPASDGDAGLDRLYEEVAFLAYHFGWSHETVLTMPHWERRRWCTEISRINERVNEGGNRR
nr:DUF6760 family protein [Salinirubrum litoreum]